MGYICPVTFYLQYFYCKYSVRSCILIKHFPPVPVLVENCTKHGYCHQPVRFDYTNTLNAPPCLQRLFYIYNLREKICCLHLCKAAGVHAGGEKQHFCETTNCFNL